MNNDSILALTYLGVLVFSAIHYWAYPFHRLLYKSERIASYFSGGMAIAYVFIHLMGELSEGYELVGMSIHFVTLMGFLVFYGLERLILKTTLDVASKQGYIFYFEIFFYCLYNYLVVYAIPGEFQNNLPLTFLYIISVGFHLLHNDYSLAKKYPHKFRHFGRYSLVFTLFIALFTVIFTPPVNEFTSDLLIAILAGAIISNVFSEELPSPENASFRWFSAGIATYVFLLIGIWLT